MTVRRQFRRFLPALLSLPLAAVMFVPASASAATSSQQPYFTVWQAGTPMPAAPAGYTVMVWPPQQVLQTLKVGQTVPAVVMTATQATKMAATPASYTGLEDAAGQVNLEFVPTPYRLRAKRASLFSRLTRARTRRPSCSRTRRSTARRRTLTTALASQQPWVSVPPGQATAGRSARREPRASLTRVIASSSGRSRATGRSITGRHSSSGGNTWSPTVARSSTA